LILFLWALLFAANEEPDVHQVSLKPFDLVERADGAAYISGVDQLESDGKRIYIRDAQTPYILVVNADGKLLQMIGGRGGGPGEFRRGPLAMAVDGPALWALSDYGKRANYFENGEHILDFPIRTYNVDVVGPASKSFAFTNQFVLIPAHPSTKRLAALYGYDGELKRHVGDILPINRKELRKNPALNDTLWLRDDQGFWYALFKYRPLMFKFDQAWNQVAAFALAGPEIERRNDEFEVFKPKRKYQRPLYHFTDFKYFRGKLYALSVRALYQFDRKSGRTLGRTYFFGDGAPFAELNLEGEPLALMHIAFLEDGTAVLGHSAMPWGHDLWKANLPFLKSRLPEAMEEME